MADRPMGYLASHLNEPLLKREAKAEPTTSKQRRSSEVPPMKQPFVFPNPLLREARRPAKLQLPQSLLAARRVGPAPAALKPPSRPSVREQLLRGVSADLSRLQANPALFNRVFPPPLPAVAATKSKRARESTHKLLVQLHTESATGISAEEQEARRFESKMRSVWVQTSDATTRKHSHRMQRALQLSTCDQLPFEKLPEAGVASQRMRGHRGRASQMPSALSRELR
ncbi:hypothetical protein A9K55_009274 [Cordyceps militaris]|uniref:Uncharacterized protein n=1 Tax=Cordyceps militaris TaxID=73501 RepID=A0A2H4SK36_CORMI|nr:hypothetical protein A9K55_009274 [Cordyceps militaris]